MFRRLRRWYARRGARSALETIVRPLRTKVILEVHAGESLENPVTGGSVFAYRIEVGHAYELPRFRPEQSAFGQEGSWAVRRPFTKQREVNELPDVVLKSRDGVRVLLREASYRLRDEVTIEGEPLPRDHPFVDPAWPYPPSALPAYRSFSLSPGQVVLFDTNLVPLAGGSGSAYRGELSHGCTLEARSVDGGPIDVLDLVGWSGF